MSVDCPLCGEARESYLGLVDHAYLKHQDVFRAHDYYNRRCVCGYCGDRVWLARHWQALPRGLAVHVNAALLGLRDYVPEEGRYGEA